MAPSNKADWKNDPEYIELLNFLIEKSNEATSPLSMMHVAEEFRQKSGSSQQIPCLHKRIWRIRSRIREMDSIDTETKVKMLFALSVPIDENFSNELRNDALVEIDGKNRITKYKANDGSLELEGDHSRSAKARKNWVKKKHSMARSRNLQEDSDDEDSIPRTPGSTKREAAAEVPSSSKRTRDSSPTPFIKTEDYDPDDSVRIPEFRASGFSPNTSNPELQQLREPKLEEAPGPPFKTELESNDTKTSKIKFLEAIHFLVINLDMPSLSLLKSEIEKKLQEATNAKIPIDEVIPIIELLIARITNNSVPTSLSGNLESVTLSNFLCYLKAAILNSKLEGLDDLLEKIKKRIKDLTLKDKSIPVEEVANVLQTTLNNIGF